ncbi:hypothetical protein D3C73_1129320 [compost metagenome]
MSYMNNVYVETFHPLPVNDRQYLRRSFLHFIAHGNRNRLLVQAVFRVAGHFAEDSEICVALHIPQNLALFIKTCPLLAGIAVLAFGNRGYAGLHNVSTADNDRCTGVHVCDDMTKCAIYSLLRRIEG